jgi:hypothetical protein
LWAGIAKIASSSRTLWLTKKPPKVWVGELYSKVKNEMENEMENRKNIKQNHLKIRYKSY